MELNRNNIFFEIFKLYTSIPQSIFDKPLILWCNKNTYNIYKIAYADKFGYSLPEKLNYIGIEIMVNNDIKDNVMFIAEKNNW